MFDYVARQYRWYKLEFGLTMLSWWEVSIFSAFASRFPLAHETRREVVVMVLYLSYRNVFSLARSRL